MKLPIRNGHLYWKPIAITDSRAMDPNYKMPQKSLEIVQIWVGRRDKVLLCKNKGLLNTMVKLVIPRLLITSVICVLATVKQITHAVLEPCVCMHGYTVLLDLILKVERQNY